MGTPDDETAKALREYMDAIDAYIARTPPPSFTCPRCRMTTYNPMDVLQGYCGNCHDTTALELLVALSEVAAELDDDESLPPLRERNDGEP